MMHCGFQGSMLPGSGVARQGQGDDNDNGQKDLNEEALVKV